MDFLTVDRPSTSTSSEKKGEGSNEDLEVDNSKSVLLKIATLYAEQLMSDLVLEVGKVGYPAHRLILCASSEVFQVMLMNREWSEWSESRIVLQETPAAIAVFSHFLKYFYTGQIKISHQTVLPVLSLADKYNVKDLVSLCLGYMSRNVARAAQRGQLVAWMQYTIACGHDLVAKECQNYLKWNLEAVCAAEGGGGEAPEGGGGVAGGGGGALCELEGDALLALLQQTDLVVHNEMTLYQLAARWLIAQRGRARAAGLADEQRAHEDALVAAVFAHVRFPMMCPKQLAKLLLCPLTAEHREFFMERMAVAMAYQSGQHERVAEIQQTEAGRLLFTPRLYTEDTWGSVLSVDNFHSLPCYHTRTFIFSTKSSMADFAAQDKLTEWTVDLYPKGVWFRKSLLIVWARTYDVPEAVLRTVRISITCQSVAAPGAQHDTEEPEEPDIRVKVGVLVWGRAGDVEHVARVQERVHRFNAHSRVLNIDGALDFDELNTPLYSPTAGAYNSNAAPVADKTYSRRCSKCTDTYEVPEPRHLLGPDHDQLRIQVVILPLTDYSHVGPQDGSQG